uniref:Uncharacterized protein n=1 Tax=Klebsiella pneumoniae TaxID=573 RepID=A0A2P1BPQ5_KLEPN|nr:hypothetical protein [Klebsiella pneumoniae]
MARQMTMPSSGPLGAHLLCWPSTRAPNKDDKHNEAVIAAAARLALEDWASTGSKALKIIYWPTTAALAGGMDYQPLSHLG